MNLAGRTALVTGASRGIGEAVARALAAAGVRVALTARSADAIAAIALDMGPGHLAVASDITQADEVAALAGRITDWGNGPPDVLINNAGVYPRASAREQDADEFARTLELNLAAPFRVVRAFLPAMLTRRRGDIITVGSVADRHIFSGNAAYSASKYGARALHEVVRAETRGTGVRASLVAPGAVDTAIWNPHERALGTSLPKRGDMLQPADVARVVVFVVSSPWEVTVEELRIGRS